MSGFIGAGFASLLLGPAPFLTSFLPTKYVIITIRELLALFYDKLIVNWSKVKIDEKLGHLRYWVSTSVEGIVIYRALNDLDEPQTSEFSQIIFLNKTM